MFGQSYYKGKQFASKCHLVDTTAEQHMQQSKQQCIVLFPCHPHTHTIYLHVPVSESEFLNYFLHFVYLLSTGWHLFCKINVPFVICIW